MCICVYIYICSMHTSSYINMLFIHINQIYWHWHYLYIWYALKDIGLSGWLIQLIHGHYGEFNRHRLGSYDQYMQSGFKLYHICPNETWTKITMIPADSSFLFSGRLGLGPPKPEILDHSWGPTQRPPTVNYSMIE